MESQEVKNTMLGTLSFVPAMFPADLPGVDWQMHDDLCDCEFQAAGFWTNPYIGSTHKVRLCCLRARMREAWPELFQDIPAYYDGNTAQYIEGTAEWNSPDMDMPRAIWYRQLARRFGKTLPEIREEYSDQEPPRARFTPAQLAAFARAEQLAAEDEAANEEGF